MNNCELNPSLANEELKLLESHVENYLNSTDKKEFRHALNYQSILSRIERIKQILRTN